MVLPVCTLEARDQSLNPSGVRGIAFSLTCPSLCPATRPRKNPAHAEHLLCAPGRRTQVGSPLRRSWSRGSTRGRRGCRGCCPRRRKAVPSRGLLLGLTDRRAGGVFSVPGLLALSRVRVWGPSQGPEPDAQTGLRRPAPAGIAEGEQPACAAAAGPPRARMGAQGGGGGGWAPSPGAEFRLEVPRFLVGVPSWGEGTGRRCDFVCAGAAWREGRGGAPGGLWSSHDPSRQPSGLARPSLLWKYARAPLFCQASFWAPGRTGKHTKSCSVQG